MRSRSVLGLQAVIIVAAMAAGFTATAAGFDCRKAGSRAEKLICADPALSDLDSELKRLYDQVKRETYGHDDDTGTVIDFVGDGQRLWLRTVRDACRDAACLRPVYSARIADLRAAAQIAGTYVREDARVGGGSLIVRPRGSSWQVSADIGGIPDGAATHADCRFDLAGVFSGSAFDGVVLPDDTDRPEPGTGAKRPPSFSFSIEDARITIEGADPTVCGDDRVIIDGVFVKTPR